MSRIGYGLRISTIVATLLAAVIPIARAADPGDIVVIDPDAGLDLNGALFVLDSATGARSVLSDFGNPAQGPTGRNPVGVGIEASGSLLLIDRGAPGLTGRLFRVDGVTGTRTLVSDFANRAQGAAGSRPSGIAIEGAGTAVIADPAAGRAQQGALFRLNPSTGARVVLSDFGDPRQGVTGDDPGGVAIESTGAIVVIDPGAGSAGMLFRVDPRNGSRTVLSDFGDGAQGPRGASPEGLAVEASGTILVIDPNAGTALNGALFRVDPGTGHRSLLSDFGDDHQGPVGSSPGHVAVQASGSIVVTDPGIGDGGALVRVDPSTGVRAIVSDFGSLSDGPLGEHPAGVSVVGAPTSSR